MENKRENIDKVFRDKLEEFTAEPPAHVWNNIREQMVLRRGKVRMIIYRWSAVAALLILALIAGWYFDMISVSRIPGVLDAERIESQIKSGQNEDSGENIREKRVPENMELPPVEAAPQYVAATRPADVPVTSEENMSKAIKVLHADTKRISMERINRIEFAGYNEDYTVEPASKVEKSNLQFTGIREAVIYQPPPMPEESGQTWEMGFQVSPGYSSYSSNHAPAYASNMAYPSSELNGNVCGGISIRYKTRKRWKLESGVYYARNGQKSECTPQIFDNYSENGILTASARKLYFNPEVDIQEDRVAMNSVAGIIDFEEIPKGTEIVAALESIDRNADALLTSGVFSQVFDFLEIPLYLRYLLISSKMDVELVGGVSAGMVVGNNAYLDNEYGMQKIGKTRDISTLNVSGTLGLGFDFSLSKHLSLAVEPRINYYLNSINNNPDVEFRPYRMGVYTGLYYEF